MQLNPLKTNTVDLLVAARDLLEKGWCKGASARNAAGIPTPFMEPTAVCFCVSGALCRLMNYIFEPHRKARAILMDVTGVRGTSGLAFWNDAEERTKEDVLAAYDQAIVIARKQQLDTVEQIG